MGNRHRRQILFNSKKTNKSTQPTQQVVQQAGPGLSNQISSSSGSSGASVLSGSSGSSGSSGASGASVLYGASGASVLYGASGASGASGSSGASGASVLSGASGASVLSGASGASGESGESGFISIFNRIMEEYGYYPTGVVATGKCNSKGYQRTLDSNYLRNYSYCDPTSLISIAAVADAAARAVIAAGGSPAAAAAASSAVTNSMNAGGNADTAAEAAYNAVIAAGGSPDAADAAYDAVVTDGDGAGAGRTSGSNQYDVEKIVTNQNDMNQILQDDLSYINQQKGKLESSLETKNRLIVLNDNQRKRNIQWIYITVVWVITLLAVLMIILVCKLLPEWFPCNIIIGILIGIGCILTIIILMNLAKRNPMNYDQLNLQSPTLIDSSGSFISDASGSWGLKGCVGSQCCDPTSTVWISDQAKCIKKEGFENNVFIELVAPTSMPYTPYTVEKYKSR